MRVSLRQFCAFVTFALILLGCTESKLLPLAELQVTKKIDQVSIEITDYSPASNREFRHLFMSNFSVRLVRGELQYSTARDGMYDSKKLSLESEYGFTDVLVDQNGDGFSDLVMWLSGINLTGQNSLYCSVSQKISSSNDIITYEDTRLSGSPLQYLGLRDCEKTFLQLNTKQFDFDKDGIPDYLELRNGLNPKNVTDANTSISADGMWNLDKVKRNIPVDEEATSFSNQSYAYEYKTEMDISGVRTFKVSNIPVLKEGQDNFIAMYLTEVDKVTKQEVLYTAYLTLNRKNLNQNIKFAFWGKSQAGGNTNQEILAP